MRTAQQNHSIIIIGAGAAGLMAARELSAHCRVTILEASDLLGGRIATIYEDKFTSPVESGAEFMHGELPLTEKLLKQAGIHYTEIEGDMYQVEGGRWEKQEEMIEGWDDVMKRMSAVKEDSTMAAFLERHYGERKYEMLRQHIKSYAQGFDLADINEVSVKALYKEWSQEEEKNFRIEKGYSRMIDFLAAECRNNKCAIYTGSVVKQVKWEKDNVAVYTKDGREFKADKVLVTLPVSILQRRDAPASIEFIPAIEDYLAAAANIAFGNAVKAVLLFEKPFWEDARKDIGFIFSNEKIPVWWTQLPSHIPLLTGWLGGPPADAFNDKNEEELLELALGSLANIFKMDLIDLRSILVSSYVINWSKQEYTLGAYSYSTPSSGAARKKLTTPVDDTIYFAGEALYEGASPATVEAALNSGAKAAERIMTSWTV